MPAFTPRFDLRSGVTEPVLLLISRRQIETGDMPSVLNELKILTAAREDIWLYRGQMSMMIDGFDGDPRELVDIDKVRTFLREFATAWPDSQSRLWLNAFSSPLAFAPPATARLVKANIYR